uniref:Arf-GAP domain and FG repeat-containing protein 1-like n=1 Tax=Sinocyclocheilus anshuiensis TaxID=1608454 RepID=A0A671MG11_9TELE
MAASAKRKQEEKHLKMLREMTSLTPNRKCFDCDQRGPTYANMTVGSFVCTSCSGILRGLNPPHRVKSISMTTFTQQEIEFLQKHGNEVCKRIWLSLYDDRNLAIPDFREPQKVKEFLQDKYEKKRWYVPPEQAKTVASVHASISGSSASSTSSTPEVRPLKTLLGESVPTLHLNKNTPSQSPVVSRTQLTQQQQHQDRKFNLLSDLGGDIFAAPHSQSTGNANFANFAHFNSHLGSSSGLANANFADFENFPKSCGADFASFSSTQSNSVGEGHKVEAVSVSADRYAALADLDNMFGSKPEQGTSRNEMTFKHNRVYPACVRVLEVSIFEIYLRYPFCKSLTSLMCFLIGPSTNPFVAPGAVQAPPTNPFQTNGRAAVPGVGVATAASFGPPSMSMPTGFGNAAAYNLPTSFSGNFQQAFPGQPFPQQHAYPQQPNGGFAAFGQGKVTPFGQNMTPGVTNNPFLVC